MFNTLPVEICQKILKFLKLQEKIKLRRVCKQWKYQIDNLSNFKSLIIASDRIKIYTFKKWFDTNKLMDYENFIFENNITSKFFKLAKKLLMADKVKELTTIYLAAKVIYPILQKFNQIEKLELFGLYSESGNDIVISLPNLEVLSLVYSCLNKVIFETPKLKKIKFKIEREGILKFNFSSIEHAEFHQYNTCIEQLINLRFLICLNLKGLKDNFLSNFPKIEEIHTNDYTFISNLQSQKLEFNRINLKIFLFGLDSSFLNSRTSKTIDKCSKWIDENRLNLYVDNPLKITDSHFPFECCINYSDIELVYPKLRLSSKNIIEKFVDLDSVTVSKEIVDESEFIEFIGKCGYFSYLILEVNCVSDQLAKNLSKINPFIKEIDFTNKRDLNYTEYDLEPLFNFPSLINLKIQLEIFHLEFARRCYKNIKGLRKLWFNYKGKDFCIYIYCEFFELRVRNRFINQFETVEDAIKFCKDFKIENIPPKQSYFDFDLRRFYQS